MAFQLGRSDLEYAVKSLCDLAMEAKRAQLTSLQLQLMERAQRIKPDDAWTLNQYADALLAAGRRDDALFVYERAKAYDLAPVAKNGRAEVLKAMNRLEESLSAYEEAIAAHPADVVAKTGQAGVLVGLGRYAQALLRLGGENPVTPDEWITYHIRGMTYLAVGNFDEAFRIFDDGIRNNPRPISRDYFRSAAIVARIRQRQSVEALEMLGMLETPTEQAHTTILALHAYGSLGEKARAMHAYSSLPRSVPNELSTELHTRFIVGQSGTHSDEWLFQQEVRYVLRAA